jgi:hypothetical protein
MQEVPISSALTLSPTTAANPLPPMPVASYIRFEVHFLGSKGHVSVESETRLLSVPAVGF